MNQITELEITDEKVLADMTVRDRLVADTYRRLLDAVPDESAPKMVTWGLSDHHSWIVRRKTYQAKWRTDDAASRPLPFDALKAKPAFGRHCRRLNARAPQRSPG
jgi:endo-1,4-beta-xylanase